MKLQAEEIKHFQKKILSWYAVHKRDLPWRDVPFGTSFQEAISMNSLEERAYKILLSEVMAQQTQLARVIPKYEAWLQEFPTIERLASAKTSDILRLWSGLGYNRRALYLQKTAQEIVLLGKWPRTVAELEKLPGIGNYTAGAVACFAFDVQIAVVDTNVRKVILLEVLREPWPEADQPLAEEDVQEIADQLLPKGRAYEWNQALMDYSAAMLKDKKVPIAKQSKFIGSNRYFRGKLLRALLQNHELLVEDTKVLLQEGREKFGEDWLMPFLKQMEKDGFICTDHEKVRLKE